MVRHETKEYFGYGLALAGIFFKKNSNPFILKCLITYFFRSHTCLKTNFSAFERQPSERECFKIKSKIMRKTEWEVERLIGLFASRKSGNVKKMRKKWIQTRARKMQPLMMIKFDRIYESRKNRKGKYKLCLCTFEIQRKRWWARAGNEILCLSLWYVASPPGFLPTCNYQCTHPFNRNVSKFF